jgi:hypothetical protein
MLQKLKRKLLRLYSVKYKNKELFDLGKIENKDILMFNYWVNKKNAYIMVFKYGLIDKKSMTAEIQPMFFKKMHINKYIQHEGVQLILDEVETNLDKNRIDIFLSRHGIKNVLNKQNLLVQRAEEYK